MLDYYRFRGLVAEKKDEQLFFVQNEGEDSEQRTPKSVRCNRPLRSHSNLLSDPVISRTNHHSQSGDKDGAVKKLLARLGEVSDSSEDEREYSLSSRYSDERRQYERELARTSQERLSKSQLQPASRDLWADDINGRMCIHIIICIYV